MSRNNHFLKIYNLDIAVSIVYMSNLEDESRLCNYVDDTSPTEIPNYSSFIFIFYFLIKNSPFSCMSYLEVMHINKPILFQNGTNTL